MILKIRNSIEYFLNRLFNKTKTRGEYMKLIVMVLAVFSMTMLAGCGHSHPKNEKNCTECASGKSKSGCAECDDKGSDSGCPDCKTEKSK